MKRWISILIALALCGGLFYKAEYQAQNDLKSCPGIKYSTREEYYSNPVWLKLSLAPQDKVIFGSSELASAWMTGFHPNVFLNEEDSEPVLVGRGYTESLYHAMALGAVESAIETRKVVLIVSPQWYLASPFEGQEFSSTFSKAHYDAFMANPRISDALKGEVTSKVLSKLTADGSVRRQIRRERTGEEEDLLTDLKRSADFLRLTWKGYFDLLETAERAKKLECHLIHPQDYPSGLLFQAEDWEGLDKIAEFHGRNEATNNPYFIRNAYFLKHVQDEAYSKEPAYADRDYSISDKFSELDLFLKVCQETGIRPLIVSVPVNGRWYDWAGYPAEKRVVYYDRIRSICQSYGVDLADFSDREYDPYFLFDTMHLGRKGWIYVSKAIRDFY